MTGPSVGTPEASVIIACFNATATLPLQLEALSRQVDAPAFEVILADNGSLDDLLPVVDSFSDRLDIRYVWAGQMPGAGYARNVGMSIARADKWLFCDADDVVAPDWVACGAMTLDAVPVFSGGGRAVSSSEFPGSVDEILDRFESSRTSQPIRVAQVPAEWPVIMGGNFGMTRTTALRVAGFDASLARGVEDNDLAIRLENSGIYVSGGSSMILYRKRLGVGDRIRDSFINGKWHMALARRHDIVRRSPVLRGRRWMADPIRVAGAAFRTAAKGRGGDWPGVCSRAGLSAGLWSGWLQFRLQDRLIEPMVGAGLGGREPDLPADSAVLVLSPHLDDALFSCSELIRRTRPEVWTVFAGDPDPAVTTSWDRSCGFPDSHALVTQRRGEDLAAFRGTGAQVRHLDMLDGVYTTPPRRAADLERLAAEVRAWVTAHRDRTPVLVLPACAGVPVSPGVADRVVDRARTVAGALRSRLGGQGGRLDALPAVTVRCGGARDVAGGAQDAGGAPSDRPLTADSIDGAESSEGRDLLGDALAVLKGVKHRLYQRRRARAQQEGLAVNGDHVAVRDAVLGLLDAMATEGGEPVRVLLAEDLPYLWSRAGDEEVRRICEAQGFSFRPFECHMDREWKHARIAHYVSQLHVMDPARHRFDRSDTIPAVERGWELIRS